jgi:hypothetical protein
MRRLAVFGLLATTVLAGCDFMGGLLRHGELEGQLTPECVRRGLEAVDDVSDVSYLPPSHSGEYHRFDYRVAGLDNHLLFEHRFYGTTRYWNEYSRLNSAPPQEEVDRILPQLRRIDASIGHACGIEDLPAQVSESCRHVDCE